MPASPFPRRVPGLDGLRACACLWVVLVHFAQATRDAPFWDGRLLAFALRGELAVPVFFVLSGFLLALPFAAGEQSPRRWRAYAGRRLARVLPGYLFCLAALAALGVLRNGPAAAAEEAARVGAAALCLSPFHPATVYPTYRDPALWSVPVECWFYVLFAAAVPAVFSRPAVRRRNFLLLFLAALAAAAAAPSLLRTLEACWDARVPPGLRWANPRWAVERAWLDDHNPLSLFPHFLVGVGLCLVRVRCLGTPRGRRLVEAGRRRLLFDAGALGIGVAVLAVEWQALAGRLAGGEAPAYAFPLFPAAAAGLMLCLAFSRHASRPLDGGPLRAVARYSFGIYLWHMPVLFALGGSGPPAGAAAAAARLGLTYAVAFGLGAASYHLIEEPGRRLLGRLGEAAGREKGEAAACPAVRGPRRGFLRRPPTRGAGATA